MNILIFIIYNSVLLLKNGFLAAGLCLCWIIWCMEERNVASWRVIQTMGFILWTGLKLYHPVCVYHCCATWL